MLKKSKQMLASLIDVYHQGKLEAFLPSLSKEQIQELAEQRGAAPKLEEIVIKPEKMLKDNIHYSWLVAPIETFAPGMREPIVAALPPSTSESLSKLMAVKKQATPSPPLQKYLLKQLCVRMALPAALPVSLLPQEPLTFLARSSKEEIVSIIDFFGLYDLAEEIKTIVDKNVLKGIYGSLTPLQQKFLRTCLYQRQHLSGPKLGLANWHGTEQQLCKMLHRRGIMRLGYALSGHHPDLIWHIVHRLDVGRGKLLQKSCAPKEIANVTLPLQQQVLAIINFFKQQENS